MIEKVPKVNLTYYNVGPGNYFRSYPTSKGYYADGSIAGKRVQMEGKDLEEIQTKLLDFLTNTHRERAIDLSTCEGLKVQIKEGGLGKLVKNPGEKK